MNFVDLSPAPDVILCLLLLGADEIGPDGEHMRLRWMPPYDHWLAAKLSPLAMFIVADEPWQRKPEWMP